jgi:hypothetical protein
MTDDLLHAASNVAEDYPGGASALARAIDKNPNTFLHELAETGTAKLGLKTAQKMTLRTRDLRILNAFAASCGAMVLPLPEALSLEGDDCMLRVAETAKEFSDLVQVVSSSISGGINANEMARIRREWGELMAAGQQLMAHLEAQHAADSATPAPVATLHTASSRG